MRYAIDVEKKYKKSVFSKTIITVKLIMNKFYDN